VNRSALAALVLSLVLSLALAGCSPGSQPLIRAGSQTVTVEDFDRTASMAAAQYQGTPATAKAELIDDLRRRAVLLEMAHRLGYDTSSVAVNTQRDEERRMLLQLLYARVAPQGQRVSEAEARALYEARNEEAHVHLIYSSSREGALGAVRRLRAGEAFAEVAVDFSILGVLPPTGDLDWVAPGALPDPLDGALRHQKLGEISEPLESREGWFVMMVSERRPRQQQAFEVLRASMYDLARQRKFRAAFNRAYQSMKEAHGVHPVSGGSQLLFRVMSPVDPLPVTAEMRQTPLATYDGKTYKLEDAYADMARADNQQPPPNLLPAIEIWIEAQVMTRVAVAEAKQRHLHEEPDAAASLRSKRDQALLQGAYEVATQGVPPVGPEMIAMAWDRVKGQFSRLASVTLAVLDSPDSAVVASVGQAGAMQRSLAEAAKQVAGAPAVAEQVVTYPSSDPLWTSYESALTQQAVGMWIGPLRTANGWRLMQVTDKQMRETKWESLPDPVRQSVIGNANELARDQRFREFTDSLSTAYHVQVDQALVAAELAFPPAPPGMPAVPAN
jgi:parvulin-like peptidyl-prolyl isomerase